MIAERAQLEVAADHNPLQFMDNLRIRKMRNNTQINLKNNTNSHQDNINRILNSKTILVNPSLNSQKMSKNEFSINSKNLL